MADSEEVVGNLFHVCTVQLAPGSVILPGNWGRIIAFYGKRHNQHMRETVLENVRKQAFQQKPSRLSSAFACVGLDNAVAFRQKTSQFALIYRVTPTAKDAPFHIGDWQAVEPLPPYTKTLEEAAQAYWSGAINTHVEGKPHVAAVEAVFASPLEILRQEPV